MNKIYKRIFILSTSAFISISALMSCYDHCEMEDRSNVIRFDAKDSEFENPERIVNKEKKTVSTRMYYDISNEQQDTVIALTSDNEEKTLYLHIEHLPYVDRGSDAYNEDKTIETRRADPRIMMNRLAKNYGGQNVYTMYDKFRLHCLAYRGSWNELVDKDTSLDYIEMNRELANLTENNEVRTTQEYLWPGAHYNLRFYAVAPDINSIPSSNGVVWRRRGNTKPPVMEYETPSDHTKQYDLMVAATGDIAGNNEQIVPLTFKHALSLIKIHKGDIDRTEAMRLNDVWFENIHTKGDFNLEGMTWTNPSTPRKVLIRYSRNINSMDPWFNSGNVTFRDTEYDFLLMPQILPNDAKIAVSINLIGTNENFVFKGNIGGNGKKWLMNRTTIYTISTSPINRKVIFEVTPSENNFDINGGITTYTVNSYKVRKRAKSDPENTNEQYQDKIVENVGWDVAGCSNGADADVNNDAHWNNPIPAWLNLQTNNGVGGSTTHSAEISALSSEENPLSEFTRELRQNSARGTAEQPYNLSSSNGTMSNGLDNRVSNCYVINSAGHYVIQIAYPGATVSAEPRHDKYLPKGINAYGDYVKNSLISTDIEGRGIISSCDLAWEDRKGLIKDVKLFAGSGASRYLYFRVDRDNIGQGNALVRVKDASGQVIWSYHLWVTSESVLRPVPIVNHQRERYMLMRYPIGYTQPMTFVAEPSRVLWVRFKQRGTNKAIKVKFNQTGGGATSNKGQGATMFQWGRKDPLIPLSGNVYSSLFLQNGTEVKYTDANLPKQNFGHGNNGIANGIKNPDKVNEKSDMDAKYRNPWNFALNSQNDVNGNYTGLVKKTMYDPSPYGFTVPPIKIFTGFSKTGNNIQGLQNFNIDQGFGFRVQEGVKFYTEPNGRGETIMLVSPGPLENTSRGTRKILERINNGKQGFFWLSGNVGDERAGRSMMFLKSGSSYFLNVYHNSNRGVAGFILPAKEVKDLNNSVYIIDVVDGGNIEGGYIDVFY